MCGRDYSINNGLSFTEGEFVAYISIQTIWMIGRQRNSSLLALKKLDSDPFRMAQLL